MDKKNQCKFYKASLKRCIALKEVYCDKEECTFYKPKGVREYDKDTVKRS